MPTPKLNKGLGRKRDHHDARDLFLPTTLHEALAVLPTSVDVFHGLSLPIYDQGQLGSCTANAGVLYRRFLAQVYSRYSAPDEDLSRLYLYYHERMLPWNNDTSQDAGAESRDIFFTLQETGVCSENDDPYNEALFADPSVNNSPQDNVDAVKYKIGGYHRVLGLQQIRGTLASGYAVTMGFTVYASFENIGSDGIMPMPSISEDVLGGHEVVIHGYDDGTKRLTVQNSWGGSWGHNGQFYCPYDFVNDENLSQADFWMGHMGPPWVSGKPHTP